MPPSTNLLSDLDSSDIIADVTMTSLKKVSSSLHKVTGNKKTLPRVHDVAGMFAGPFNPHRLIG
jgi:hypothetical protein